MWDEILADGDCKVILRSYLMIKVVFITVLVLTTETPSQGWLQWSDHYKDIEVCKKKVDEDFDKVSAAIKGYLGKKFVSVLKMGCMTHEEAADLNTKLGH